MNVHMRLKYMDSLMNRSPPSLLQVYIVEQKKTTLSNIVSRKKIFCTTFAKIKGFSQEVSPKDNTPKSVIFWMESLIFSSNRNKTPLL